MTEAMVSERLANLPPKVAAPLGALLSVGQLNEEVLGVVLDAAELAGAPQKALGFAVGYLHLQSQHVPVRDTIRMAKHQGRRIRLEWSARRWHDEHDRLSRAETLERLQESNIRYELPQVSEWLPSRFRGYVIRTSRRLGMEGLRQRHCVASYHTQILAGYCIIVAVFVNRVRWTVQLARTGDEKAPLRIVQIRSRFNRVPTLDERAATHRELGIPLPAEQSSSGPMPPRPRVYMENLRRILPVLREHAARSVTVTFDGSGDSGSIDDVQYEGAKIDSSSIRIEIDTYQLLREGQGWVKRRERTECDLDEAIEKITDEYLEETSINWYDNDGGYGELILDVEEGTVSLEINLRHTDSSTEFSCTRDIATGEDVDA